MPLSWNDIRARAINFAHDWADETSEDAEAKTFYDQFFQVFGVDRRRANAAFESRVSTSDGKHGYIDLLWRGILLVEHKSRGQNLDRAYRQATDYFPGLKDGDLPDYILVCDFQNFRLYNLVDNTQEEFTLKDFPKHIKSFGFMSGYQTTKFKEQDPVNVKAAERMGRLHDRLRDIGYEGHKLELYLVRLLFCMFAEDAAVFERRQFQDFIEQRTSEDGADLAARIAELFQVLNTPEKRRLKNLDEQLAAFRYVNGRLFEEALPVASFDRDMRESLLECCALDWSKISPAVFGAMFQSIMDKVARRNLGAHYTSEKNIMKLIGPLFLDDLRAEFESVKSNRKKLDEFHDKIARLKFLDPACGCGNFLIIAYRELRLLELDILRIKLKNMDTQLLDITPEIRCNVDQFYGIEIEEFPAQIAQTAMWLTDHQMNNLVADEFGKAFARLPLEHSATIINDNALRLDWRDVVKPAELNYILGNPPFIGAKYMTEENRKELLSIFSDVSSAGLLDYVTAWYGKAVDIMKENPTIATAFVSTNSITQGEQVGVLWGHLLQQGVKIHFAHRTFQWSNEARGKAAVHCVIIGFALFDNSNKRIFDYETIKSDPQEIKAKNINPYLVDAPDTVLNKRSKPLSNVPEIGIGNKPIDGGNYLFTTDEKNSFIKTEPLSKKHFRQWLGAEEFINNIERWCLWLGECSPQELKSMPECLKRVEAVRKYRLESKSAPTRKIADTPTRFHVENIPNENYLAIPEVSSERRPYIPIGFLTPKIMASNKLRIFRNANLYHFGILSSTMHMAWTRQTCGRLESRYQYSVTIVYNNFPWPENVTAAQKEKIEQAAQGVLDARAAHPKASLADLYDPLSMPPDLVKAHRALDAAVDAAYSRRKFAGDADRVAYLFELYQKLVNPMEAAADKAEKKAKRRKKETA